MGFIMTIQRRQWNHYFCEKLTSFLIIFLIKTLINDPLFIIYILFYFRKNNSFTFLLKNLKIQTLINYVNYNKCDFLIDILIELKII